MGNNRQIEEQYQKLLKVIQFIENISTKIYGVEDESNIFEILTTESIKTKQYATVVLLLTEDRTKLKVRVLPIDPKKIKMAEKIGGMKLRDYAIDLNKSKIYSVIIKGKKAVFIVTLDLVKELFPKPIAYMITKVIGYSDRKSIITPLYKGGDAIGLISVTSPELSEYFIPPVENFARHISIALELAERNKERKKAEEEKAQYAHNLEILSEIATKFVELPVEEDIYEFIGKQLKVLVDDVYVIVNSFNRETNKIQNRAFLFGKYTKNIYKLLGKNVVGMSFTISNEAWESLNSGKIVKVPGGLYELAFGEIPRVICDAAEKLIGMGDIYTMGFTEKGELYGNAVIVMRKGSELRNQDTIELFMRQAGVFLQRRQAEEELKKSEERYRNLFDLAPEGIITLDMKGMVTSCNAAFTKITGFSKDEIVDKHVLKLPSLRPIDLPTFVKLLTSALKGKIPETLELDYKRKDETVHTAEAHPGFIKKDGKTIGIQVVLKDISERKKLEQELIHSEKMAGVGTLAAGVAHEFNNLLQVLNTNAEFAIKTGKTENMKKSLNTVLDTADKAAKITEDLLTFSWKGIPIKKVCRVTEPLELVLSLVKSQFSKQNIEITKKYIDVPDVDINKEEMQQVFLNMVTNARDSMFPKGGQIRIEVKQTGNNAEIRFSDTGKGIKKGDLHRIFEPFYTTKGALGGNPYLAGTGLGLSVSYGIMQRHNGTIEVNSEEGKGTTFILRLPLNKVKTKREPDKGKRKNGRRGIKEKNILVVDDEKGICDILTKSLSLAGHKVKSALNAKRALNLLKKEDFDIVFLDILLSGISGIDLLKLIKDKYPGIKVIMISGKLMDKKLLNELKQKGADKCIQKPFKIADLMGVIRSRNGE
jgi:PAS domain S-box-containing protein